MTALCTPHCSFRITLLGLPCQDYSARITPLCLLLVLLCLDHSLTDAVSGLLLGLPRQDYSVSITLSGLFHRSYCQNCSVRIIWSGVRMVLSGLFCWDYTSNLCQDYFITVSLLGLIRQDYSSTTSLFGLSGRNTPFKSSSRQY